MDSLCLNLNVSRKVRSVVILKQTAFNYPVKESWIRTRYANQCKLRCEDFETLTCIEILTCTDCTRSRTWGCRSANTWARPRRIFNTANLAPFLGSSYRAEGSFQHCHRTADWAGRRSIWRGFGLSADREAGYLPPHFAVYVACSSVHVATIINCPCTHKTALLRATKSHERVDQISRSESIQTSTRVWRLNGSSVFKWNSPALLSLSVIVR